MSKVCVDRYEFGNLMQGDRVWVDVRVCERENENMNESGNSCRNRCGCPTPFSCQGLTFTKLLWNCAVAYVAVAVCFPNLCKSLGSSPRATKKLK